MYGQSQMSVPQNPHTGLTARCSPLHQISPGHTYRKLHVPIYQVFHLGMLIMHIFCAVISPFCSFSCSKLGKGNVLDQRELFLHHGVIWLWYEPKPCVPLFPFPWCVPNLPHCAARSSACVAPDCGAVLVHVNQVPFRGNWSGRSAPGAHPCSSTPHDSIRVSSNL